MSRGLKVPCPLVVNIILFINISKSYKVMLFHTMKFRVAYWDN